jgi:hypothetical protein
LKREALNGSLISRWVEIAEESHTSAALNTKEMQRVEQAKEARSIYWHVTLQEGTTRQEPHNTRNANAGQEPHERSRPVPTPIGVPGLNNATATETNTTPIHRGPGTPLAVDISVSQSTEQTSRRVQEPIAAWTVLFISEDINSLKISDSCINQSIHILNVYNEVTSVGLALVLAPPSCVRERAHISVLAGHVALFLAAFLSWLCRLMRLYM